MKRYFIIFIMIVVIFLPAVFLLYKYKEKLQQYSLKADILEQKARFQIFDTDTTKNTNTPLAKRSAPKVQ